MNVTTVASEMIDLIYAANKLPDENPAFGKDHLLDMCAQIQSGAITGEKAHRWIGWIQCAVVIGGGADLQQCKEINFNS